MQLKKVCVRLHMKVMRNIKKRLWNLFRIWLCVDVDTVYQHSLVKPKHTLTHNIHWEREFVFCQNASCNWAFIYKIFNSVVIFSAGCSMIFRCTILSVYFTISSEQNMVKNWTKKKNQSKILCRCNVFCNMTIWYYM